MPESLYLFPSLYFGRGRVSLNFSHIQQVSRLHASGLYGKGFGDPAESPERNGIRVSRIGYIGEQACCFSLSQQFGKFNLHMSRDPLLPTWTPRVKPYLIRRLYESDAQGRLDENLLDEVGWALYSRCDSFIHAREASLGQVRCPVCGGPVQHNRQAKEIMRCPGCGWECPVQAYLDTIKNQQLDGGPEVIALFQGFLDAFPKAKKPPEKMLLVDSLIHGFHHFLRSGRTRRPVGINLIDGHLEFVMDFLDHLSYGPGSTPGVEQIRAAWRESIRRPPARKKRTKKR